MKKFIIAVSTAIVGAVIGAYADKKYNLGVKERVDGCIDSIRGFCKKAGQPAENTTENISKAS